MTTIDSNTHSLLLVVTNEQTNQLVKIIACDGIDPVIDIIAAMVTLPEEDQAVSYEIVQDAWRDACHTGDRANFVFHRFRHHLVFTMMATKDVEFSR